MIHPKTLGRYQIVKLIGGGGMGTVYEAFDPNIARRVALKTILISNMTPEQAEELQQRFLTEGRSAGLLQHDNIIRVFDADRDQGIAYLVMELVEGDDLDQQIKRGDVFTLERIFLVMRGLLAALDHAHNKGIIHRDIKPANLLIDKAGNVKLGDFGVARITGNNDPQLTSIGGPPIGTYRYMSPEQMYSKPVDGRTDIWAAGVILYQLLTGQSPFGGTNWTSIILAVQSETPKPVSTLNPGLPPELDAVVAKALAKQPDNRFRTAREFMLALRAVPTGGARGNAAAPPASPTPSNIQTAPTASPSTTSTNSTVLQDSSAVRNLFPPGGAMPMDPAGSVPAPAPIEVQGRGSALNTAEPATVTPGTFGATPPTVPLGLSARATEWSAVEDEITRVPTAMSGDIAKAARLAAQRVIAEKEAAKQVAAARAAKQGSAAKASEAHKTIADKAILHKGAEERAAAARAAVDRDAALAAQRAAEQAEAVKVAAQRQALRQAEERRAAELKAAVALVAQLEPCPHCAAVVKKTALFCGKCGKQIERGIGIGLAHSAPPSTTAPTPDRPSTYPPIGDNGPAPKPLPLLPIPPARPPSTPRPKNEFGTEPIVSKKALVITACALATLLIGGGTYYALSVTSKAKTETPVAKTEATLSPAASAPASTPVAIPAPIEKPAPPPVVVAEPAAPTPQFKPEKRVKPPVPNAALRDSTIDSAIAATLAEASQCMARKQYDCVIANADGALRLDKANARAKELKRQAKEAQNRALSQIQIQ